MKEKVYLISALDKEVIIDDEILYKIGVTKQEKNKRLKQLSTGTVKELNIVKEYFTEQPYKIENVLHRMFSNKRINKEWFALDKDDVINFLSICEKIETNINYLKKHSTLYGN